MKTRYLAPALALLTSACTLTAQDKGVNAEFHPPFVSQSWHVEHYRSQNGAKACAISSGYNGLTVTLSHPRGGEAVSVQSNRRMEPGATLTVNVDAGRFETGDAFFSPKSAQALVEDFAAGGQAYLEWSEFSGFPGRERAHVQNIVKLDDFGAQLQECRDSLKLKK